jgi:hypothetical protein
VVVVAFRLVTLMLQVGLGWSVRIARAGAAKLGQVLLKVLQVQHVGVVGQTDRIGYGIDLDIVDTGERPDTLLQPAGAVWAYIVFKG